MIFTTTDTLTPDTDPGECGAILKKELPERNPPPLFGLGIILFHAPHHGPHGVGGGEAAPRVGEVGHVQRFGVDPRAVAVEVVLGVIVFRAVYAPAGEDAVCGLHGHESAVERFHLPLCGNGEPAEYQNGKE